MVQPILFPDVEALLVTYLTEALTARGDSATVHTKVPTTRPSRFVLVPRRGGVQRDVVIDDATIAVECWADTDGDAAQLTQLVRALLMALPARGVNGTAFYRYREFAGPQNFPDGTSAQSRYTFTCQISCRGIAI